MTQEQDQNTVESEQRDDTLGTDDADEIGRACKLSGENIEFLELCLIRLARDFQQTADCLDHVITRLDKRIADDFAGGLPELIKVVGAMRSVEDELLSRLFRKLEIADPELAAAAIRLAIKPASAMGIVDHQYRRVHGDRDEILRRIGLMGYGEFGAL